mmetsp:Transcript_7565/g.23767  ORF Transcript_7565/g.23767 Transcript_7565/m.23767 type:complete len:126 (+) Transcript_7565:95-472(+)
MIFQHRSPRAVGRGALLLVALALAAWASGRAFAPRPAAVRPPHGEVGPAMGAAIFSPLWLMEASPAVASDATTWKTVVKQKAAGGLGDAGTGNITLVIGCIAALVGTYVAVTSLFNSFKDKPLPK